MPVVRFHTQLRRQLGIASLNIAKDADCTVGELIEECEKREGKPILSLLLNSQGELAYGMIFLNGSNILLLNGLATIVQPADELNIFPPSGGG